MYGSAEAEVSFARATTKRPYKNKPSEATRIVDFRQLLARFVSLAMCRKMLVWLMTRNTQSWNGG